MKKGIILVIFLTILIGVNILYFMDYKIFNENGESNIEKNTESGSLLNEITQEQLSVECDNVINGEGSSYLDLNKNELMVQYNNSLEVLENNEYNNLIDLKNGNCDIFEGTNKTGCKIYKTKDTSKLSIFDEKGYDYNFLKSLIENKDYCDNIENKNDVIDCKETFKLFFTSDLVVLSEDIISLNSIERGNVLINLGKDKYLELLKKQFLIDCNKL